MPFSPLQVPVVDLALPEAEAAAVLHDACTKFGFLYGEFRQEVCVNLGTFAFPCVQQDVDILNRAFTRPLPSSNVATAFDAVRNHGVPADLITQHFDVQRRFFELPLEKKLTILADDNNRWVGTDSEPKGHGGCGHSGPPPAGGQPIQQHS